MALCIAAASLLPAPAMAAIADEIAQSLDQLRASTAAAVEYLAISAELLRIREASGELTTADRQRALQATVAQVRSSSGSASTSIAQRDRRAAALRLIALAESRVSDARWPAGRPAAVYRELARTTLGEARTRLAYLSGLDASLVDAVAPAAEVLGWTQGRTGGGAIFDGLDADIEVATRSIFADLPRHAGTSPLGVPPPVAGGGAVAPGVAPSGGMVGAGEPGTDRQTLEGNVIRTIPGAGVSSAQCSAACDGEGGCGGWVLVRPGHPNPGCYLMTAVTRRIASDCCRSDVKGAQVGGGFAPGTMPPSPAVGATAAMVPSRAYDGVSLSGQTLRYYPRGSYAECDADCQRDPGCRGWTWVKPGAYRAGDGAMCYLVSRIDSQGRHAGSVSAIKGTGGIVDRLPPPIATTPSAVASFIGCYRDTSDFDLKGYLERSTQNTPQRCVQICAGKGFAYAGVQYGESCLCGNSYGRYGQANNCNMACTGDRQQSCGGFNANSVYTTGIVALAPTPATTPAPPPAPPALSDKTCWDWYGEFLDGRTFTGHTVTFQVDGNKVAGTWGWTGTWRTDGKRNFWVYWSTRPDPNQADMLTLSADGRTLEGRNFETRRIRGTLRSCS